MEKGINYFSTKNKVNKETIIHRRSQKMHRIKFNRIRIIFQLSTIVETGIKENQQLQFTKLPTLRTGNKNVYFFFK